MDAIAKNEQDIIYRPYTDGDETAIVSLFNFVFNRNMVTPQWEWAYKKNPENRLDIILAFAGDKLVGQSASTPLRFCFKKNLVRSTRTQNVMVHPDFRGMGIFTETLKQLTDYIYEKNLDLVVTFPNNNSIPTFIRKLDYHHLADIFTYTLPVSALPDIGKNNLSITIDETIRFSESDRQFMLSCLCMYDVFNVRQPEYLHWRFSTESGKKYLMVRAFQGEQQVALVIFKYYSDGRSVDLVEFFAEPNKTFITIVLTAIRDYFSKSDNGIESLNIWLFPHYHFYPILREIGFEKSTFSTHVVTKSFSPATKDGFNRVEGYLPWVILIVYIKMNLGSMMKIKNPRVIAHPDDWN
jgi:RimJ/RimL family protein N-acetyltransferase